jgi:translation elongation factor EF-1beta
MGAGFIDIWPARWLLPVAFGLMAIYLMVRIRQDARHPGDIAPRLSA